jgi:hypothetical protein
MKKIRVHQLSPFSSKGATHPAKGPWHSQLATNQSINEKTGLSVFQINGVSKCSP